MPGSDTSDWWRYSGVNVAKFWSTPNEVERRDDNDDWVDSKKLYAKDSSWNLGSRNASVIKFEPTGLQPAIVRHAILRLHGETSVTVSRQSLTCTAC